MNPYYSDATVTKDNNNEGIRVKLLTLRHLAALACAFLFVGAAQASPITFNFTYSGAAYDPPNTTLITGAITFESSLVANPGINDIEPLPDPAVLALSVTVSGASSGNGTFGLADFGRVSFITGPDGLNFSSQLVGQPTGYLPFGTPPLSSEGEPPQDFPDFNLLGNGSAPFGQNYFTLCPSGQEVGSPSGATPQQGDGDCAILTSMIQATPPSTSPTPALSPWSLTLLAGLLALAGFVGVRRYRTAR